VLVAGFSAAPECGCAEVRETAAHGTRFTTFAAWFPGERDDVLGSLLAYHATGSPQP
jgi:hypothetical protein